MRAVTDNAGTDAELSPTDWVREQTQRILEQGTTDGVEVLDRPIVLFTTTGAKSGKKRFVPLMRVEENGKYAMVASKGGDPEHPAWYHNVKAHPQVTAQDGEKVVELTAREIEGAELGRYWPRLVALWPAYQEHYERRGRRSVFVLEPVSPVSS